VRFPPRIQTCASLRSETEVGQPGEVIVEFPLSEWSFNAFFQSGRRGMWPNTADASGAHRRPGISPAAGGIRGYLRRNPLRQGNGSLSTTSGGQRRPAVHFPNPKLVSPCSPTLTATSTVMASELGVTNLARTPRRALATITVEANSGDTLSFKAERAGRRCFPEGTVYWDGPDRKGLAGAELARQGGRSAGAGGETGRAPPHRIASARCGPWLVASTTPACPARLRSLRAPPRGFSRGRGAPRESLEHRVWQEY
jgi:hypothetical protein